MRRWMVLLVAMGLAGWLGAEPAAAQKLQLSWWEQSNPPRNRYSAELAREFSQKNPRISVEYNFFPFAAYWKKLTVALATKTGPDMFTLLDHVIPVLLEKKVLAPIRPEWLGYKSLEDMKARYLPGALEGYLSGGKLYAVPITSATNSLYINKKHFREAGLDPEKDYPRNWEELGRVGQKLVRREGGKMVREGFDFAMHSSTWTLFQLEPILRQFGGSILDPSGKRCTLNSEAGVRAMKIRASYTHAYKISDPTVSVGTSALPANDLAVGRVSMFITHPGSVAQFGPKIMGDLKVVPFPQVNPARPVTLAYGHAVSVNGDASPERQRAAHEVIRHVVRDPREWLNRTAFPVPIRGFLDIPGAREFPYIDVFMGDLSAGRYATRSSKLLEIMDAMHRAVERVVLANADPKESLDRACREIDAALAKP